MMVQETWTRTRIFIDLLFIMIHQLGRRARYQREGEEVEGPIPIEAQGWDLGNKKS